ncbi:MULTISPECIES: nucleotidyltransferase-like protein [unclassified Bacillus (in: firmicutes)]|uniref:nucleotidyltransferase-like protein n=1 Tax=unclassified Bacillus (in: firmicutes) TaxID=185979 RepID=UPI0008F07E95|nr:MULTISPECIES: nucleotidyltransferase-like protein [unclassified Bacillus (in: firmicutes)]SFB10182.1 Nucleotidyltransferase-like [Bacillus sp. UNCCL13]SFQ86398.1 Nucleotidyltransferase-like [Bacillus sp. cl95]
MEDILRPIYQERASQSNTLGVLMIERTIGSDAVTDSFDAILLIIVKDGEAPLFIKHYSYQGKKAAMHIVTERQLKEWILLGTNRKIFEWLYNGKILFDRNEYIGQLKTELRDFPFYGRKLKMGVEFAKLIRRYMDGKALFEKKHYLDAYNHIVHSLHHLARLAVIENGFHPEVTVWHQVKQIEPEIFKLYEELVNSEETLEKRLELLFLASEFMINSRTYIGATHLLEVLEGKEYWSFNDMLIEKELIPYSVDLGVLIEFLVEKNLIDVHNVETKGTGVYHRHYKVSEKLS